MKTRSAQIPLAQLLPAENNGTRATDADVADLAASIRELGVLEPLLVRAQGDNWQIIAGSRRAAAATLVGLTAVPCLVFDADGDKALEIQLHENLHRKDLDPFDECALYELMLERKADVDEIARRAARSRGYINRRLALARMPAVARKAVASGLLSFAVAEVLVTVTDNKERDVLAKTFIDRAPGNVREAIGFMRSHENRRDLDEAPFDVKDATLAPAKSPCYDGNGTCAACPYNSVASGSLLAQLGQDPDKGGRCLNAAGWASKVKAHAEAFRAKVEAEGGRMLTAAEAKKAVRYGHLYPDDLGLMDLDSEVWTGSKHVKASKLVEGATPPIIGHVLASGRTVRLVKKADAPSLARKANAASRTSPAERNERAKRDDQRTVNARLLQAVTEVKYSNLTAPNVDRWLLERLMSLCGGNENNKALCAAFGYKTDKGRPDFDALAKATDTVLKRGTSTEVRALTLVYASLERWGGLNTDNVPKVAELLGVQVAAITKLVKDARDERNKLLKAREAKRARKAAKKGQVATAKKAARPKSTRKAKRAQKAAKK